jgi:hypothetical protein
MHLRSEWDQGRSTLPFDNVHAIPLFFPPAAYRNLKLQIASDLLLRIPCVRVRSLGCHGPGSGAGKQEGLNRCCFGSVRDLIGSQT